MKLVLDTNVVASALLWGGNPRLLMESARNRGIFLYTSAPLLFELSDILSRNKFARKIAAHGLSVDALVQGYAALAIPVHPIPVSGIAPDPDDDVVIGTALAVQADAIVTGDRALLTVGTTQGARMLTVSQALAEIESARH